MISKTSMDEYERIYQIFIITPTFGYNFLIEFCGDNLLIVETIFIIFREKIHLVSHRTRQH